jgi:hypothetical protein
MRVLRPRESTPPGHFGEPPVTGSSAGTAGTPARIAYRLWSAYATGWVELAFPKSRHTTLTVDDLKKCIRSVD